MTTTSFSPDDDDFRLSPEQAERLRKALDPLQDSMLKATATLGKSLATSMPSLSPKLTVQLTEVMAQVNQQLAPSLASMAEVTAQLNQQLAPSLASMAEVTAQLNQQLAPTLGNAAEVLAQFQAKTHILVGRLDLSALAAVGQEIASRPDLARELNQAGSSSDDLSAAANLVIASVPPEGDSSLSPEALRLGIFAAVTIAWFAVALPVAMTAPDPSLVNWLWNLATRTLEGAGVAGYVAHKVVPSDADEASQSTE